MKIKHRLFVNSMIFILTALILILSSTFVANSLSKIVNKVDIVDVIGLKLIREENDSDMKNGRYRLVEIPENINIIDARIVNKSEVYKFSNKDNILLDSSGNVVSNLKDQNYTLVLNTKELGEIYKIINKTVYGYKVLDIKVVYNKYKNTLEISNSNVLLGDSEVTIFKNDAKVGSTKLDANGKGSIYINDIENLTTSTYTILIKKGSEIVGIDAFHMTPTYRDLNLKGNVNFNIISEISNKLNISISGESGITVNDKVQVASVYDELNPNENLLLNLDCNKNNISDLNGEIILKNTLSKDKKYKVRLKVNGVELDPQDDCDVHIKNLDISKIKITAVEKIGKELRVDLSGINNLSKDDLIEVISLYDIKNKEKNLISPTKITNKVNEIPILDKIDSNNSYELVLKINNFMINGFGVEVIPVDLMNSSALTDIISNKIFISLENAKGLKITDSVKVIGVFKEGDNEKNFLKSSYNTMIEKLNGTVFINQTLDTKNNYYIKFKINDIELENTLKVIVNNNICLKGASASTKISSHEIKVCFKNVDSINISDMVEIDSIFDLNDNNFNLLDKSKETKILNKVGIVYLKAAVLNDRSYGMKIKINGVEFSEVIPIFIEENEKIQNVESYFTNENKLVLNLNFIDVSNIDKIEINSLKCIDDGNEIISDKIMNLSLNDNNELIIPLNFSLKDGGKYLIGISVFRNGVLESYTLEFNNKLKNYEVKNEVKNIENVENKDQFRTAQKIDINSMEFGDGYFKFEHNLDKSMNFNKSVCYVAGIESRIDDNYIVVDKLIPYKKYKDLKLHVKNDRGCLVEFKIPEFDCKESKDDIKNFISKTYIKVKNGLNVDENNFEFADEAEFWFWHNKIKKKEVDLRNFVLNILNEKEFMKKYVDNSEKIKILYNVIFGINPSEQSLNIWLNDFNKTLKTEDLNKALKIVVEKMFTNLKFKSLEKQLK